MTGETVTVEVRSRVGTDAYGGPVWGTSEVDVPHALVAPGDRRDLGEDRPEGREVLYTVYMPKTFAGPIANARIRVRGRWFRVIGHSDSYFGADCPTDWHMVVEAGEADG